MSETIEQRAHGIVMQGYLIESLAPHRLGELEKDIETAIRNALAAESEMSGKLAHVLEPFAACAVVWDDNEKESGRVIHVSRQGVKGKPDLVLTVGDLLDAYTALLDWRTVRVK